MNKKTDALLDEASKLSSLPRSKIILDAVEKYSLYLIGNSKIRLFEGTLGSLEWQIHQAIKAIQIYNKTRNKKVRITKYCISKFCNCDKSKINEILLEHDKNLKFYNRCKRFRINAFEEKELKNIWLDLIKDFTL